MFRVVHLQSLSVAGFYFPQEEIGNESVWSNA
jgi:hypothetical protein